MQIKCSAYEIVMVVHELHQQGYEQLRSLAARLTPEQLGVVVYISALYGKWNPYDDQSWIIEY